MRPPEAMDPGLDLGSERRSRSRWDVVLGAWTGVSLFSVGQIYLAQTALGDP